MKTATEKFENNRSLTQADIDTIVAWANASAPRGDPKDLPPPRQFVEGWSIPKPDVIFQLPKPFSIPESGILEYQYVILPTGFTQDRWVQFVEAAPSDRSVVHHIVAYVRRPGSNYFKDSPKGVFFEAPPSKSDKKADPEDVPSDWLVGYAPGQPPDIFKRARQNWFRPVQILFSKCTTCRKAKRLQTRRVWDWSLPRNHPENVS